MLFNSYEFILFFAPLTFIGFFLIGRRHSRLASVWMALASVVFYGWWNPYNIPVLLASVVFNYLMGIWILRTEVSWRRRLILTLAVASDLGALGYFKYANFLMTNLSSLAGLDWALHNIVLPLGISFFTFTQIAYLVDTYKGVVTERNPVLYLLFVTYFPHLIAGPVIHHKDVMPQFAQRDTYHFSPSNFVIGVMVFILGLFKKCFLADNVASFAAPIFAAAEQGAQLGLFQAWGGALSYTFQLYFDFSGYSDMAVGLSLIANVRLPINFNSPYKAVSIIDFWRRWHISLSTFLRDYLYIALGGNRRGKVRRFANLLATMLIGGLWHGAAWTFVAWGGLHGLYLIVNHAWRRVRAGIPVAPGGRVERALGWALTFLCVVVAWVFFRANTFSGAATMLEAMAGANGVSFPADLLQALPWLQSLGAVPAAQPIGPFVLTWGWCIALITISIGLPNTPEFISRVFADPAYFDLRPHRVKDEVWRSPPLRWAVGLGALAALAVMNLVKPAEFLYFNF